MKRYKKKPPKRSVTVNVVALCFCWIVHVGWAKGYAPIHRQAHRAPHTVCTTKITANFAININGMQSKNNWGSANNYLFTFCNCPKNIFRVSQTSVCVSSWPNNQRQQHLQQTAQLADVVAQVNRTSESKERKGKETDVSTFHAATIRSV